MRALRGVNASMVLIRLNPIIRGWTAYYRTVVSSAAFRSVGQREPRPELLLAERALYRLMMAE